MRITKKGLLYRVQTLNMILERPETPFLTPVGVSPIVFAVGHLSLDKNSDGYALEECINSQGGTRMWGNRSSARDTDIFLTGITRGIGMRNTHIGELLIKTELDNAGLPSGPLYSGVNNTELGELTAFRDRNKT